MPGQATAPITAATTPPPLPRAMAWPLAYAAMGLLAAAGTVVLFLFDPTVTHLFPPCPFHALTGLYCPGCGTTRALHHLLHGHVATALGYNALTVLSLPFVTYAVAREALNAGRAPTLRSRVPWWWGWAILALVIAFGVARNLPWEPFRRLAP